MLKKWYNAKTMNRVLPWWKEAFVNMDYLRLLEKKNIFDQGKHAIDKIPVYTARNNIFRQQRMDVFYNILI